MDKKLIWKHNSFLGHAAMAQKNMLAIMHSSTATLKAKDCAAQIYKYATELQALLKERK